MRALGPLLLLLLAARLLASALSPAGAEWDFTQYYRTANRIVDGEAENLYRIDRASMDRFRVAIGEAAAATAATPGTPEGDALVPSGRLGHVGMPLSAYYLAPLGWLGPRSALAAFKLAGALCFALAWWLLYPAFHRAVEGRLRDALALPVFLALCLAFEPFWFVFTAGGQSTPLNFLLLVIFYRLWVADRPALAALALALGVLVKPFFLLCGFVLLLAPDRRPFLYLTVWLSLAGLLSLALFGLDLHLEWLTVLQVSAAGLAEPWWNNSAVLGLPYTLWASLRGGALAPAGEPAGWLPWVVLAYKIGVAGLFVVLVRHPGLGALSASRQRHYLALLAILFPLLFSSIVWPHYLSFLFLPLLFLLFPGAAAGRGPRLLAWAVLVSTVAIRGRFLQTELLDIFDTLPILQASLAGLLGAGTAIGTLLLLILARRRLPELLGGAPDPAGAAAG